MADQRTVGRDVSFTLDAGEVMCVLGPNGSGKTTLFRTILGLLEKHSGYIGFDGKAVEQLSREQIARQAAAVREVQRREDQTQHEVERVRTHELHYDPPDRSRADDVSPSRHTFRQRSRAQRGVQLRGRRAARGSGTLDRPRA